MILISGGSGSRSRSGGESEKWRWRLGGEERHGGSITHTITPPRVGYTPFHVIGRAYVGVYCTQQGAHYLTNTPRNVPTGHIDRASIVEASTNNGVSSIPAPLSM